MTRGPLLQFGLVRNHAGVGPRGCDEIAVPDELADPRPWHPTQGEQRDTSVTKIVRRERPHAGCRAGSRERGAKAIRAEPLKHARTGKRSGTARQGRVDGSRDQRLWMARTSQGLR